MTRFRVSIRKDCLFPKYLNYKWGNEDYYINEAIEEVGNELLENLESLWKFGLEVIISYTDDNDKSDYEWKEDDVPAILDYIINKYIDDCLEYIKKEIEEWWDIDLNPTHKIVFLNDDDSIDEEILVHRWEEDGVTSLDQEVDLRCEDSSYTLEDDGTIQLNGQTLWGRRYRLEKL